jgi:hypothetical protein
VRLLRFYPRAWRERYGDEMRVLLEQHHVSVRTRIDLLRGALDAQLHLMSSLMSRSLRPSVRWSLLVALLPSTFVVVQWVCQLYPFPGDSTLWNALVVLGMIVAALAATWSGTRAHRMGGTFRDSAVAGGLVGMAALPIAWIISWGLTIAGLAGVFAWAADLEGETGHFVGFSFGPYVAQHWPAVLLGAAEFTVVGCLAGTVLGLAGGWLGRGAAGGRLRRIVGRVGVHLSTWPEPQG